jgi:hypothetical protein
MARRRVTEEDLLDFRNRAAELSEVLAEKYDALEKAQIPAEDLEVREIGILVLRGADVDKKQMEIFIRNAKAKGFAAELVDLEKYPSFDNRPVKKVPDWEKEMDKAQTGYMMLTEHARRIAVLGAGDTAPTATLIAEQYPVDALVVVGQGPSVKPFTTKRTVAKLAGVAKNNLFSIVCPVYCISPEQETTFKSSGAQLYQDSTRSDDVQLETVAGMSVSGMWIDCEHELETRIFDYLTRL